MCVAPEPVFNWTLFFILSFIWLAFFALVSMCMDETAQLERKILTFMVRMNEKSKSSVIMCQVSIMQLAVKQFIRKLSFIAVFVDFDDFRAFSLFSFVSFIYLSMALKHRIP